MSILSKKNALYGACVDVVSEALFVEIFLGIEQSCTIAYRHICVAMIVVIIH